MVDEVRELLVKLVGSGLRLVELVLVPCHSSQKLSATEVGSLCLIVEEVGSILLEVVLVRVLMPELVPVRVLVLVLVLVRVLVRVLVVVRVVVVAVLHTDHSASSSGSGPVGRAD